MPETTRTVDILVLGATGAGLTTAVEAARAGASVIVVDLAEATRFGTGLVTVAQGPRLRDVELHRGLPAVERLIAETLRGIEWLRQNLPAHGVELTPRRPSRRTMQKFAHAPAPFGTRPASRLSASTCAPSMRLASTAWSATGSSVCP